MTYPKTRQEYKNAILHNIYKLVQALETDDNSDGPAWIAQAIHYDTREFFDESRWKPTPVADGILALIPKGEVLTFRFQNWQPEPGSSAEEFARSVHWVTGRVTEIHRMYSPDDGARFEIIPTGKRNPRKYQYRVSREASLQVWRGKWTPEQAQARAPLYDHADRPQCRKEEAA